MAVPRSTPKGARATPARRRRQPAERTAEILDAALDQFARRDFNSVTIRDIARQCRINIALIYYYFNDKEELFRAAIGHAIKQALGRYGEPRRGGAGPVEALDSWFDINIQLFEPLSRMAKIIIDYHYSPSRDASLDRMIERLYAEERALLQQAIRQGIAQGVFRKVDPARAARFVSTHLDGIFFASMSRRHVDLKRNMADLRTTLWDYLGYRPPAAKRRRDRQTP
ncbi:MAG: TetR/AcrR family transcriptional regulator [Dongiaceae bacterium]